MHDSHRPKRLYDYVGAAFPGLSAYKGNHFPGGQSFVCFKGNLAGDKSELTSLVEEGVNKLIAEARQVVVDNDSQPRTMTIQGFSAVPCGGTHVDNIAEIGRVTIRNIKKQKEDTRIGYDIC